MADAERNPRQTATELVDRVAAARPEVVELARLSSVATIVEPSLLRTLRLRLAPAVDAGAELDLWFSPLVRLGTATALTLQPDVAAVLRRDLCRAEYRALADEARALVLRAHRQHSEMLQLEEEVIWASIVGDHDLVEVAMRRVAATVASDPEGAADVLRWLGQAWRRMPKEARSVPTGRRLLVAAALHLDRQVPPGLVGAPTFPDGLPVVAPPSLATVDLTVELLPWGLRFSTPAEETAASALIELADTVPPVVEVRWWDGRIARTRVVSASPGDHAELQGLSDDGTGEPGDVELRSLTGDRYRLSVGRQGAVVVIAVVGVPPEGGVREAWNRLAEGLRRVLPATTSAQVRCVVEPPDLFVRPEILVLAPSDPEREPPSPARAEVLAAFHRAVRRARERDPGGEPAGVLVLRGKEHEQRLLAGLASEHGPARQVQAPLIYSSEGRFDDVSLRIVAAEVERAARRPGRLYELSPQTAGRVLQSLALAFHTSRWTGGRVEEAEFYGLADSVQEAQYQHVRAMAEYIVTGPVLEFLAGRLDPTWPHPALAAPLLVPGVEPDWYRVLTALRTGLSDRGFDRVFRRPRRRENPDETWEQRAERDRSDQAAVLAAVGDASQRAELLAALTDLNGFPRVGDVGLRDITFSEYLDWYVARLLEYAQRVADGVAGEVRVDYWVAPEDLEAVRLLVGRAALQPLPAPEQSARAEPSPRSEVIPYRFAARHLPRLVRTLSEPVRAAVSDLERARTAARRRVQASGRFLAGGTGPVRTLAWSADGALLAAGGDDGAVRLWDPLTGERYGPDDRPGPPVRALRWGPRDETLIVAGDDGLLVRDALGTEVRASERRGSVQALAVTAFSSSGLRSRMAFSLLGELYLADDVFVDRANLLDSGGEWTALAFSWGPDGQTVLAAGRPDGTVQLWEPIDRRRAGLLVGVLRGPDRIRSLSFQYDDRGRSLLAAADGDRVVLWNMETQAQEYVGPPVGAAAVAWSPVEPLLAVVHQDGTVTIDLPAGGPSTVRHSGDGPVDAVAWSPDGRLLAAASTSGVVAVFPARRP